MLAFAAEKELPKTGRTIWDLLTETFSNIPNSLILLILTALIILLCIFIFMAISGYFRAMREGREFSLFGLKIGASPSPTPSPIQPQAQVQLQPPLMTREDLLAHLLVDKFASPRGSRWENLESYPTEDLKDGSLPIIEEFTQAVTEEGRPSTKEVESWKTNDADNHFDIAYKLSEKGDIDGAIAEYRRALKIDPLNDLAHYSLGVVLQAKGDVEEAFRAYTEAIRINPNNATYHNDLGAVLHNRGDIDGAIIEYQAALKVDPNYALAHAN